MPAQTAFENAWSDPPSYLEQHYAALENARRAIEDIRSFAAVTLRRFGFSVMAGDLDGFREDIEQRFLWDYIRSAQSSIQEAGFTPPHVIEHPVCLAAIQAVLAKHEALLRSVKEA